MHTIVVLADDWGFSHGGINVFNKLMCEALADYADNRANIVCCAPDISKEEIDLAKKNHGLYLQNIASSDFESPKVIVETIREAGFATEELTWLGHDSYTDELAIACRDLVENSKCALIHHMAYSTYYSLLNKDPSATQAKVLHQKEMFGKADYVFANGPLLEKNAQDLCKNDKKVTKVYPGIAEVQTSEYVNKNFNVISFGRVEKESGTKRNNTIVKQIYLAVAAWAQFSKKYLTSSDETTMKVIGSDDIESRDELNKVLSNYSGKLYSLLTIKYMDDRDDVLSELVDSSLCLVLSAKEGFGMTALEAISAGVPTIVSKNSGFYRALDENNLTGFISGVDIEASFKTPFFTEQDLENVVKAIYEVYKNIDTYKEKAILLKEKLEECGFTWETCAKTILDKISGNAFSDTSFECSDKGKDECEKLLIDFYWKRYDSVSAQKEGENKNDEIVAKICDVYMFPQMQENNCDCEWGIDFAISNNRNILIEAPNGYGKTTMMRSILLAATYDKRADLSENDRYKYDKIKKFHHIDDSDLFIYIECNRINFNNFSENKDSEWFYEYLLLASQDNTGKAISKSDLEKLIQVYNAKSHLIILLDGFDEVKLNERSLLLEMLNNFQQKDGIGCNSRIIVSSRPLFWKPDFSGYRKYTISNKKLIEDKSFFDKYSKYYKSSQIDELYETVNNNFYLKGIVQSPATVVWIIRELALRNEFCELMERIIEQMMLRYESRELTVHKDQYIRVYEELAYTYLSLTKGDSGIVCMKNEFIPMVRSCIEKVKKENNRKFNQVFDDNKKTDEELGELFFTNVALMECINGMLKFATNIYAFHLSARYVLRSFRSGYEIDVIEQLSVLPYQYRYYVMVIASSLALHLSDTRFFEGFGENASEIRFEVVEKFFSYFVDRWNSKNCNKDERYFLSEAIRHIIKDCYGDNVFTNPNMSKESYKKWMVDIVASVTTKAEKGEV